jgi:hypothetical protein
MGEWLTILNHVVIYAPIITLQEIGVLSADYIFTGTDEYVKIIFTGFETDEYKIMFISLGLARTNIWDIRFDFDRPHIYIYIHHFGHVTDEYQSRGPPIFIS